MLLYITYHISYIIEFCQLLLPILEKYLKACIIILIIIIIIIFIIIIIIIINLFNVNKI